MKSSGTSIHDLRQNQHMNQYDNNHQNGMINDQYNNMQQMQHEGAHHARHVIHQSQHDNYYDVDSNIHNDEVIKEWNPDVDNQLNDKIDFDIDNIDLDKLEMDDDTVLSFLPSWSREPVILILIYVLLSQTFIQKFMGKYISQINPNIVTGEVNNIGILIYAIFFAALYIFSKKMLME